MKEKDHIDPVVGKVRLRKSLRARRVSIRVHPVRGIVVTVPFLGRFSQGIAFLETRREWALDVLKRMAAQESSLPEGEDIESLRARAKAELPPRLKTLAERYGFKYNRVTIKHNSSNWGSCSTKGNINLNLNLMRVPEPLQDYILLHELTHLHHSNHGPRFHAELEQLLADHFSHQAGNDAFDEALRAVAASRSPYPFTRVLEKSLRRWRLV